MNDNIQFQRLAAVAAILSAPLAFGSVALSLAAVNGNAQAFLDGSVIAIGLRGANLFRWAMLLDIFGFYLLLAPLALVLWHWLEPRGPNLVRFYTVCGLAYILIGAMGAVVLSAVEPPLMIEYAQASASQREILEVVFNSFYRAVDRGLWNPLEALLASIWWLGIGLAVRRERSALGVVTVVLGLSALLDAVGRIFTVEAVYQVGVGGLFLLLPIWALWFGIDLLRRPVVSIASIEAGGRLT